MPRAYGVAVGSAEASGTLLRAWNTPSAKVVGESGSAVDACRDATAWARRGRTATTVRRAKAATGRVRPKTAVAVEAADAGRTPTLVDAILSLHWRR